MKYAFDERLLARARELGPLIQSHADEAERERKLSKPVIAALEREGMTKLFLPRSLGGHETDPLTYLRIVEELASFDSVVGWMMMVANSGAWFAARLPTATAERLFSDPEHSIIATAFQPPVVAREVPGGYRVTGRRPFASGAHAARHATLTAMVMDGDQPRMHAGMPVVITVVMDAKDVSVADNWNGLGLRGSDSCDISVEDLFVPKEMTCMLAPVFEPNDHYRSPLYRFPMVGAIVLASIPPIAVAIARRAIDEVRALSSKRMPMGSAVPLRDRGAAQARLGRAEGMLRAARVLMYDAMAEAWDRVRAGTPLTLEEKADLLLTATHVVQTAVQVTDAMYTAGGSSAVFCTHPLERLFRDAQVIRQHGFVAEARYETFAQVFLGLEPDLPVIQL